MRFFDAHLDLAYLTETGRDMHAPLKECRGRHLPAAVTLPSLREGGVAACLGTIFTEAVPDPSAPDAETGAFAYPAGDALAAYRAGMRQLKLYQAWEQAGVVRLLRARGGGIAERPVVEGGANPASPAGEPLLLGVLMECADPIVEVGELEDWARGGVAAVGMAWTGQGRYAAGNAVESRKHGLTGAGRELAAEMDRLGVVHDASHLSQRAVEELFEATDATVIASHSNCRALMGDPEKQANQRHLADETIREIARRGGIVGINLVSQFLDPAATAAAKKRATIADVVRHVEHACAAAGGRAHVGLGSDMDGGLPADRLPSGIDRPADLVKLAEALRDAGWSDAEVEGFCWGNWARFWGI